MNLLDSTLSLIVFPLLAALMPTLIAWLLTMVPGPVRDWLQSGTHQRDVELVMGAMLRRALASAGTPGTTKPVSPVLDVIAYVKTNLPETMAKLGPNDDALRTMAQAAVQQAAAQLDRRLAPVLSTEPQP